MALIGSLVVTVTARTDEFENKLKATRTTLKLTQDQAAAVTGAFTALGGALTKTGTQAGASAQGIDRATTSLKNVKKASDDVSGSLGSVAGGIKSLTTSLGGLALAAVSFQAIKAGVGSLLASATASQSLTAAFTAIAGSAQEGRKQLDFVRGTADKLGFSFTTLAGSYKGLSAASRGTILEGQATRDLFTAVATASRVLQLSTQDTSGILNALQQIMSKGTVQAEELRGQIGERLPGAFGLTARAIGVTEKELTKLLETGNLGANVFIPKFASQLIKEYGGGAEAASKTFAAASARLGNAFTRLGEAAAQAGILDYLGQMLDKLTGIIAAGPQAADALRKVVQAQSARDLAPLGATGFPILAAGNKFLDELNASIDKQEKLIAEAQARIAKFAGGNVANEAVQRRFVLAPLQDELARLQADKATLLTAIAAAAGRLAAQDEGLGSIPTSRYVRAQDLMKTLQAQAEELRKAVTDLDTRAALVPGSAVEIVEEKVKALDKAIKALQDTLGRDKNLLPLLQGSGTAGALRGANAAGLAAALPLIQAQAPSYGLDPSLVAALVYQESRFDPRAVSPKGARGLGQLMPATAAGLGVTDSFDIQQNLTGTMTYLQQLNALFRGNLELVLAAYNAGPGRVTRAGGIPNNPETRAYVPAVLDRQRAMQGDGGLSSVPQLDALLQERAGWQAYLDARKAMVAIEQELQQAQARTELDFGQQVEARVRATLGAFEQLKGVRDQYTLLPAERDRDRVNRLAALAAENSALTGEAERAQEAALTGIRMQELAADLRAVAAASFAQYQAIDQSTMALRAYQEQLELSGVALDGFGRAQRVTAEARAVTQAEARLRDLPPDLQGQGVQILDRLRRAALEATPAFQRLRTTVDGIAGGIVDLVESAVSGELFRGLGPTPGAALDRARLRDIGAELAERRAGLAGTTDGNDRRRELEDIRRLQSAHTELTETIRQGAREQETLFGRISAAFSALVTRAILDSTQLREALGTVLLRVVQAGIGLLSSTGTPGASSPGGSTGPAADFAAADGGSASALFDTGGTFRALGGPALAGQSYIVGERGRELFVPDQNGQVMPGRFYEVSGQGGGTQGRTGPESHGGGSGGQQGQRPVIIHMTVIANEPSAFLQPQGKIQRAIAQGVQQASRNL